MDPGRGQRPDEAGDLPPQKWAAEQAAVAQPTGADRLDDSTPQRLAPDDYAGMLLLAVMVLIALVAVAGRFLPGLAIPYSDQMLPDMLVWLALLGTVSAVRWRQHLGMSVLIDKLPPRGRRSSSVVVNLLAVTFFAVVAYRGFEVVRLQYSSGLDSPAGYPSWLVALAFPVCAVLIIGRLLWNAWLSARRATRGDR